MFVFAVRQQQRKYLLAAHREILDQVNGMNFDELQQASVVWRLNLTVAFCLFFACIARHLVDVGSSEGCVGRCQMIV
jgi:hypothetical protein